MGGVRIVRILGLVLGGGVGLGGGCRERAEAVQNESQLRQVVQQMVPAVERATGLTFKRPPVVQRRTRAQVRDYVIHKFDSDLPPAELAGAQAAYRMFGLLPDTLDLRATLVDLYTEQVAGYFDPDSATLYVAADVDSPLVRMTVSHELIHALQAQYLDLDSVLQQKRHNDRRSAAQAILEGQATLAQILVMMPEQQTEGLPSFWETRKVFRTQMAQMREYAHAPLWLRETLIFPYLAGADFVRWFDGRHPGHQPFGAAMPVSTEQILHPDRYDGHDNPTVLEFTGSDRAVRYEDDLGEFEIRLLFEQLLGDTAEAQAPQLASGWNGDRYRVLPAEKGQDALVWYSVWNDAATAARFARGLERAWSRRWGAGAAGSRRSRIDRLTIDGSPGVRLVDAPAGWAGWRAIPAIRIAP
ncbi:MAG: hypothetical protein AUH46_07070 [Gemmatimonadetes bacterium 13_1_40CM_70_15]|nr:MAG: hypothetical protein AUH46_07070 [Gemmatimonadetes bacterium 13_1_40CM_70_15]